MRVRSCNAFSTRFDLHKPQQRGIEGRRNDRSASNESAAEELPSEAIVLLVFNREDDACCARGDSVRVTFSSGGCHVKATGNFNLKMQHLGTRLRRN